jgi:16S rRNA (cytosine967-C5)-methyltransferase
VLDACCAPGGKTCHILEAEPAWPAWWPSIWKPSAWCACGKPRRLGLSAELIAADGRDTASWWDGKPFQRILLDAPCSATGVIRRHPDIKLTRQPDDIAALARCKASCSTPCGKP